MIPFSWQAWRDSNPQPTDLESVALPIEPQAYPESDGIIVNSFYKCNKKISFFKKYVTNYLSFI